MLYRIHSRKNLAEVAQGLETAAQKYKFGILGVHDLRAKLREKGVEFDRDCQVFEVCNPHQAKKVLEADGAVSTALPCRISVYGSKGEYTLATMRPTEMMKAFGKPEIEPVAQEVENVVVAMMRDAAL